jgi:flagellar biosynthesis anti-sigma factor FlgM
MKVSNNKIGGSQLDGIKNSKVDATQARGKDGITGGGKGIKDSSNVALSERAQMMKKAKDIASDQTVDEAKVSRLQKMIDEGRYSVDADKIADRLVDTHMSMPDES